MGDPGFARGGSGTRATAWRLFEMRNRGAAAARDRALGRGLAHGGDRPHCLTLLPVPRRGLRRAGWPGPVSKRSH